MSNNLERKKVVVDEIREKVLRAKSAVIVDYAGLNVEQATNLRKSCREAGVDYKVYKNNLVRLAIKDTPFESLDADLNGSNAIAFGYGDPVVPAKIIKDFIKTYKKLEFKSGVVEGSYCNLEQIKEIADLPSREVLIAKFLGSVMSPVSNFAYLLQNIVDQKNEGANA